MSDEKVVITEFATKATRDVEEDLTALLPEKFNLG